MLITTNVDSSNPRKVTMDYIMEWHLLYRSGAEMEVLKPHGAPEVQVEATPRE
jgi:extracellular factor (EF) 3-hydroxypalmitic acid methyl ester biosynthesis protein